MTRYFITRLRIEGFRGINNEGAPLELKFDKNSVNSVFAVNASGKSSIFEALCFAMKGSVPKLTELQAVDHGDEYYVNRFHSGGMASIEIDFQTDDPTPVTETVLVTRNASGDRTVSSLSGNSDPETLLKSLDESFTLLDYASFTKFTDDTPLKRGRSFASLLGLSEYSNYRQSLQSLAETRSMRNELGIVGLEATVASLTRSLPAIIGRARTAYLELIGTEMEDSADLDAAADEVVKALAAIPLIKDKFDGMKLVDIDFDAVSKLLQDTEGGTKRKRLEKIGTELSSLNIINAPPPEEDFEELVTEIMQLEKLLLLTQGDHYKHLLESANVIIDNNELQNDNVCPVCGSELDKTIEEIVDEKLAQYEAVDEQIELIKSKWSQSIFIKLINNLEQSPLIGLPQQSRLVQAIGGLVERGAVTETIISGLFGHYQVLAKDAANQVVALTTEKALLEKDLPLSLVALTNQVGAGRRFKDALSDSISKYSDLQTANHKLSKRKKWAEFITKSAAAFADAETRMTSQKVTGIKSSYQDMFANIMNTSDIVPELKRETNREDLHVELTKFHGLTGVSARAVLSESYRNALAISVYLSAAAKHVSKPRFIVLDDVTSSFDSGHQWFLMEYVRTHLQYGANPDGLQFLILSHDGLLEKYFDKLSGEAGWRHQKLQGSSPVGVVLNQAQNASRIRSTARTFLLAGQVSQAEQLIRQYLEFRLTEIIRRVRIPVPIDYAMKDHTRMVSASIEAIQKSINLYASANNIVMTATQQSDFKMHHVTGLISNWVSHYETNTGTSLSAQVLLRVLDATDLIAECFQYDKTVSGVTTKEWYRSLSQV